MKQENEIILYKSSGLVSLCIPCYNVAPYIGKFLDSLLSQTYKKLEVIIVNDGSTDNTAKIIRAYIPKLKKEGYIVIYIEQENQGLASTINNALKWAHGDFLSWPDPDDWLTSNSIEKRVLFLQSHPEAALVRCNIEIIEEGSSRKLGTFEPKRTKAQIIDLYAEKLIFGMTWYGSLAILVRMSAFDKVNAQHEIFTTRTGGQNVQLLLPLAARYSCWQIPEILGYYLFRKESHSRSSIRSYNSIIEKANAWEATLIATCKTLPSPYCNYLNRIRQKNLQDKISLALQHLKFIECCKYFHESFKYPFPFKNRIKLMVSVFIKIPIRVILYSLIKKLN